jgi:hypothetical protein
MNAKVKSKQEPFIRKMREDLLKKEYMIISPEEADALVASILEEANSPPPKRDPKHEGWVFNQKIRDLIDNERKNFSVE